MSVRHVLAVEVSTLEQERVVKNPRGWMNFHFEDPRYLTDSQRSMCNFEPCVWSLRDY